MRILIISMDYLPHIGGIAQHVSELARGLQRGGDEVRVLAVDRSSRWGDLHRPARIEPRAEGEVPTVRAPWVLNRSVRWASGQLSSRLSLRRFAAEIRAQAADFQPDLLHWHALDLWSDGLFRGLPMPRVWTNHTSTFITGLAVPAERQRCVAEARAADRIIAPSQELKDVSVAAGADPARVHFISNGVDPRRFSPRPRAAAWADRIGLQPGQPLVLCPRRLEDKNGVLFFVQAALALLDRGSPALFAIAGDSSGVARDDYARRVLQARDAHPLGRRVVMLGAVPNAEMPGLYATSDIVCIPSLIEATSISALEAMASARPVVSTSVGGLPHLVHDGRTGLHCPPADPAALERSLAALLDDPARAAGYGAAGRARVETEFSWDRIAAATRAVYALCRRA